jgi:hypothetical protein
MSYTMKIEFSDGIPTLELRGKKTAEVAIEIWSSMRALIAERKLEMLLVIDEMDDEMSVWDVVDVEAHLRASGFPLGASVAIVDRRLQQERNSNAFAELYMLNRGWHRIKAFETRERALAWLRPVGLGEA